jgi:soluble lytic murein transglycosylase
MAHWGEIWLLKGRALARMEREGEAIATYSHFARTYTKHSLAPEALWHAAQLLEQDSRFVEAADLYADLANTHTDDEHAPAARFRAGLSRNRTGDVDGALIAWRELVDRHPASTEASKGRYWLGKVLWSQGEDQEARTTLQALVDDHPRDYYALRAADILAHNGQVIPWRQAPTRVRLTRAHLTSDQETEKAKAEEWLRSWANTSQAGDLAEIPNEIAGDLRFRRAMEMHSLSLNTDARDEFEELRHEIGQDPLALYRLAILTRDLGLYAPSMRATIDLITLAPEDSVLDMPVWVQRLAFPVYYADLVLAECSTQELDPLLMFALIRQESVFDAQIASWAGAVGLAQIMPSTGQWIAEMTAWPEYNEEMLQRAYLNVKFGAWFLARILDQTEGDVMAALAGYNGGPAYATQWLEQAGGDPDLFVEIITRDEPQRYVRLIYRHYDVYTRLYGGEGTKNTE